MVDANAVRIAVEGCGHGTLHAIYASVEQSCKVKGWPDIDLLIICGDFQSVRNAYDLNCVAMPAKYREMCDFHEYYSGKRRAPYLTIFVGGNHEASNYLFELYYGGWVAPNIYYMGAANVVRLGPLRIAGMNGIWKGYDYNKLHFERLPYNEDDIKTIFHTRELDIRKLLQVTGALDVGISHDWPRGVEWQGNWRDLFRRKPFLEEDARKDQLGNVAAKSVLDKLRPRWWFSGHLHCKYAAIIDHNKRHNPKLTQRPASSTDGMDQQQKYNHMQDRSNGLPAMSQDGIELDLGNHNDPAQPSTATQGQVINADEVQLDLDDGPSVAALPHADEIQLDLNEAPSTAKATNEDEITLDLDDGIATQARMLQDGNKPGLHDGSQPVDDAAETTHETIDTNEHTKIDHNTLSSATMVDTCASSVTHFLALDKCLPGRDFLQLMEVPTSVNVEEQRPLHLAYDREWLAITRAFALHEPLLLGEPKFNAPKADTSAEYATLITSQQAFVDELTSNDLLIPENFTTTAPVYDGGRIHDPQFAQSAGGLREYTNPQTAQFCSMLGIPNPFDMPEEERKDRMHNGPRPDEYRPQRGGRGRAKGFVGRGFGRGRGRGR